MQITVKTFWLPKEGNREDEYEDAFAHTPLTGSEMQDFYCAIADGATETSFSGQWASLLTTAYVERRLGNLDPPRVERLEKVWRKQIHARTRGKPLPWYAEEKLRSGAYSSLFGLHLSADKRWRAICVGDSCMFHFQHSHLAGSYPFSYPHQFNNRPALISTNAARNEQLPVTVLEGKWWINDTFWLATDALAHFFLSQWNTLPDWQWKSLQDTFMKLKVPKGFKKTIGNLRQYQVCKNDDTTFMRVKIIQT